MRTASFVFKKRLLTPGPTDVPDRVRLAMAQPMIHHRTAIFKDVFATIRSDLQKLFQTSQEVLLLAGSGTAAMEAAVSNCFAPGDEVLVLNAGKFGERWSKLSEAFSLKAQELKCSPGQTPSLAEVEEFLKSHPKAKGFLFQASETSTGVQHDTETFAKAGRKILGENALIVVDAITALGVVNLPMDQWGIDVLITGSQKALMLPPGLALISLSERAWEACSKSEQRRFYFDLRREKKAQVQGQTAWTAPVSLVLGLKESLSMIFEEGLDAVIRRHALCAEATRAAVVALNLELLAPKCPSQAVTAVKVPKEVPDGKLIPKQMRDELGITIAGGQDSLEGKIFRLSHLGYVDGFDVVTGIAALELTLGKYLNFPDGQGVAAVLKVLKSAGKLEFN